MNTEQLIQILRIEGVPDTFYSINDATVWNCDILIGQPDGTWEVFYNERGKQGLRIFATESEACEEMLSRQREPIKTGNSIVEQQVKKCAAQFDWSQFEIPLTSIGHSSGDLLKHLTRFASASESERPVLREQLRDVVMGPSELYSCSFPVAVVLLGIFLLMDQEGRGDVYDLLYAIGNGWAADDTTILLEDGPIRLRDACFFLVTGKQCQDQARYDARPHLTPYLAERALAILQLHSVQVGVMNFVQSSQA